MFDSIIKARQDEQTVVLRGAGPTLHVTSQSPSKMLLITKNKTQTLDLGNRTNINFAA